MTSTLEGLARLRHVFEMAVLLLAMLGHPPALAATELLPEFTYACTKDKDWTPSAGTEKLEWKAARGVINLNYLPDHQCWSRIEIAHPSAQSLLIYLEHQQASTDHVELFHSVDGKLHQQTLLGFMHDSRQRPVFYRNPIFKVELQPGINQFWIRQQSRDLMVLAWRVFDPDQFVVFTSYENLLFGGFFAICFSLSLYNLIIFMVNRESMHLYYFLYLFSYGICQMFIAGLMPQYILPDSDAYRQGIGLASINIALIFAMIFVYSFLESGQNSRVVRLLYQGYMSLAFGNLLLNIFGYYTESAQAILFLSGLVSLLGVVFTIAAFRQHHPMARFFAIAWSFLLLGNIIQVLLVAGVLPHTPLFISANFFGATVEAILISFALAQRLKQQKLQEMNKRNHAFSQLEKMVLPHQLLMMRDGQSLEATMPLKQDTATVICLDLIGSTRSQIPDMKNFLRRFMDRCHDFMNLDYDGQTLTGLGYRIKELGDGFLCSVGFPFAPPHDAPQETVALELSLSFMASFDEEYSKEGISQPGYCSIGIAQGQVEGFFTLSGMRSYEMFGDGIVKATRYEALRKSLPLARDAHLIILQTCVWEKLSPELKVKFKCHNLQGAFKIRNDEGAQEFYVGYLRTGEAKELLHSALMQNRSLAEAI